MRMVSKDTSVIRARTISQNVTNTVSSSQLMVQVAGLLRSGSVRCLRVRQDPGQDGAANTTPVKGEMDWAVPQPRPGHTAKVSRNLPETTKSIRLANRPSRSFHTRSEVSQDFKSEN